MRTRWAWWVIALAFAVAFVPVFGYSECEMHSGYGLCYEYWESLIGIRMQEPFLLVVTIAGFVGLGLLGWRLDRRSRAKEQEVDE